jgi:hypothetical protein
MTRSHFAKLEIRGMMILTNQRIRHFHHQWNQSVLVEVELTTSQHDQSVTLFMTHIIYID